MSLKAVLSRGAMDEGYSEALREQDIAREHRSRLMQKIESLRKRKADAQSRSSPEDHERLMKKYDHAIGLCEEAAKMYEETSGLYGELAQHYVKAWLKERDGMSKALPRPCGWCF